MEKLALIFLYNFHREHSLLKSIIKKFSPKINVKKHKKSSLTLNLSIYLPIRLDPRGGRQTGIPEYQVLRGLVETK